MDKFLFVLHGMTPLQTCDICKQTPACFKQETWSAISKQHIQNSMKLICLAVNSESEKQHSLLLHFHFVSSNILVTGQPLLQNV